MKLPESAIVLIKWVSSPRTQSSPTSETGKSALISRERNTKMSHPRKTRLQLGGHFVSPRPRQLHPGLPHPRANQTGKTLHDSWRPMCQTSSQRLPALWKVPAPVCWRVEHRNIAGHSGFGSEASVGRAEVARPLVDSICGIMTCFRINSTPSMAPSAK
jgi:hypothetical protein